MDDGLREVRLLSRHGTSARLLAAAGVAAGVWSALLGAPAARGQISPGELSRAHASFDGSDRCLTCHSAGRGVDTDRCLACHTPLAERIAAGKGLHARPDHIACERCHIEHQGRDFALVYWGKTGERAFDHALTGYVLQGAHAPLACRSCHRRESIALPAPLLAKEIDLDHTYLGLGTRCAGCHKDAHRSQFGDADCATCHGLEKWKPAGRFDHARSKFPLTLGHARVECVKCHPIAAGPTDRAASLPPNVLYRGVRTTCAGCHKDPHQGRFGSQCETCHSADDWKRIQTANFDHARTRYPLTGKHQATACVACHPPGKSTKLPGFERCTTCHADTHAGQLALRKGGGECGECHTTNGFRPSTYTVAQHAQTPYPLTGAHRTAACASCHRSLPPGELERAGVVLVRSSAAGKGSRTPTVTQFRFVKSACQDCHRDPHAGDTGNYLRQEGCPACHSLADWREIRFDHAVTKFPIAGLHVKVACLGCHETQTAGGRPVETLTGGLLPPPSTRAWATPREVRLAGAPLLCSGCHADPHLAQVGTGCEKCHGDTSWGPSRFDHNRDSTYRLEGAHRAVACIGCHFRERAAGKEIMRLKPLGSACSDCHRSAVRPL